MRLEGRLETGERITEKEKRKMDISERERKTVNLKAQKYLIAVNQTYKFETTYFQIFKSLNFQIFFPSLPSPVSMLHAPCPLPLAKTLSPSNSTHIVRQAKTSGSCSGPPGPKHL